MALVAACIRRSGNEPQFAECAAQDGGIAEVVVGDQSLADCRSDRDSFGKRAQSAQTHRCWIAVRAGQLIIFPAASKWRRAAETRVRSAKGSG